MASRYSGSLPFITMQYLCQSLIVICFHRFWYSLRRCGCFGFPQICVWAPTWLSTTSRGTYWTTKYSKSPPKWCWVLYWLFDTSTWQFYSGKILINKYCVIALSFCVGISVKLVYCVHDQIFNNMLITQTNILLSCVSKPPILYCIAVIPNQVVLVSGYVKRL